jgi:hypothetical protein
VNFVADTPGTNDFFPQKFSCLPFDKLKMQYVLLQRKKTGKDV